MRRRSARIARSKAVGSIMLVLMLMAVVLTGCNGDDPFDTRATGTVDGRVKDNDGNGLGGATVRCGGESATTSQAGYFTIDDVPTGNQQVSATKQGYFDAGAGSAAVTVVQDRSVSAGTLVLVRAAGDYIFVEDLNPTVDGLGLSPGPLYLNGHVYLNSLVARISGGGREGMSRYYLGRSYDRLQATIGVDDRETDVNARVIFQFRGDGNVLYTSPQLKLGQEAVVDINISTVLNLEMVAAVVSGTATESSISIGWSELKLHIKP